MTDVRPESDSNVQVQRRLLVPRALAGEGSSSENTRDEGGKGLTRRKWSVSLVEYATE
jgi:hypothetical protein